MAMYFFSLIFLWTVFRPVVLSTCGVSDVNGDSFDRIVGGENVLAGEFPWLISLRIMKEHMCGGAIVDQHWVLTAGHCVEWFSAELMDVVAGNIHLDAYDSTRQISPVKEIFKHPQFNYNDLNYVYDLALLKLSQPLDFSGSFVRPICLPEPYEEFTGNCQFAGWGYKDENVKNFSEIAQKVSVPLITDEECQQRYMFHDILDSMLCTWYKDGGKDSCQGDSGGPLMCLGLGGKYDLAGIISWGVGCARPKYPAVNTQVSYFVTWIDETINSH